MRTVTIIVVATFLCGGVARGDAIAVGGLDSASVADAIGRSQAGDTVLLRAGEYAITEPIKPKSNTRLVGAGEDETILRIALGKPGQAILLAGVENVEVARLTVDGAGNPNALQGIYAVNSRRLNIHHVTVCNLIKNDRFGPHGIHFNGNNPTRERGVTDSVIADCTVENVGVGAKFGCGIRVSWGSSRNRILRCTVRDTGRGGIFGDNGSTDLVIRDNVVTGSGGEGLGIEVWGGCDRSIIEDNEIDHWLSVGGCDYCSVRRNVVAAQDGTTKPYGLEIIGSYCVVTDNVVGPGQGIGISVSSKMPKNYHFYANNTIRRCYHWGVQLQGEEGGIAYHYYYRCKFLETLVGHPAVKYKGAEGNGFRANGNVKHVVLEECEMRDNGRCGVQLGGRGVDAVSFIRCIISGNKGPAVVGPADYAALEWIDCTVEGNGRNELPPAKPFVEPAPRASLEGPAEALVGQEVTFRNTSKGSRTTLWDLGDGIPLTGDEVAHAYTRPGEYRVTLIAWNVAGRGARAEKVLRVREPR
ncbi:MAG: right-handed parallel beta-helix repeat-containing protein [Armatimonadota bacterium]